MNRIVKGFGWGLALAGVGVGCGDSGGGGTTEPPVDVITTVMVSPTQGTLVSIDETVALQATARNQTGGTMSATFTWSSSAQDVVAVDGDGVATAVANGSATITATAGGESGQATLTVAQALDALEVVEGDAQVAATGAALDTVIQVRALDALGNPAADIALVFAASAGSSVDPAAATTDGDGLASATWTVGTEPGDYELEIREDGDATTLALLTATALASIPAQMTLLDGDGQSELVATALPAPLRVRLVDAYGNPVPEVPVEFSATGGGAIEPAEALTDLDGVASAVWTLGPGAGAQAAQALVRDSAVYDVVDLPGSPVSFSATGVGFELSAISPDPAVVGGTVTLTGTGFDPVPVNNLVEIDGVAAQVLGGTQTSLVVEIPSYGCAPSAERQVVVTRGTDSDGAVALVHPVGLLELDVGGTAVLDAPADFCLQLPADAGADGYLVGLTGTRDLDAQVSFSLHGDDGSIAPLSAPSAAVLAGSTPSLTADATSPLTRLRAADAKLVATGPTLAGGLAGSRTNTATAGADGTSAGAAFMADPTVGSVLNLRVPNLATDPCNAYTAVASTVMYVGEELIIAGPVPSGPVLTALLQTAAFTNAVDAVAELFGTAIAQQVAAYIGTGGALDADGRLTVLLTPTFNGIAIPAFSTAVDLTARTTCPASDEQMIVYVAVPSMDYGDFVNGPAIVTALVDVLGEAGPRLAREATHLARTVTRLDAGLLGPLPTWLAEGQSELLVEVVGRVRRGDEAGMDYGSAVVNADLLATRFYLPRFDALARLFGWDGGTGTVPGAPDQCSPFGFGGLSTPCTDGHASGGAWSFLRYLTDRIAPQLAGGEPELHQALSSAAGAQAVDALLEAHTGATLDRLLVDWAMTLYTDGRVSPQDAPDLQMTSWDLADIYDAMPVYKRLTPDVVSFEAFARAGTVVGGGTAYLRIEAAAAHGPLALEVRDALGNALSADLAPRLWIVRIR